MLFDFAKMLGKLWWTLSVETFILLFYCSILCHFCIFFLFFFTVYNLFAMYILFSSRGHWEMLHTTLKVTRLVNVTRVLLLNGNETSFQLCHVFDLYATNKGIFFDLLKLAFVC